VFDGIIDLPRLDNRKNIKSNDLKGYINGMTLEGLIASLIRGNSGLLRSLQIAENLEGL